MYEYNLETHLSELARLYPQFTNLYSTWTLNKRTCAELLKSVILRYPHYSLHDSSHAEAVVSKIEMLLGDRIKTLSPTDTWLLLNAAYSHDLGMLVKWSEIEEVWDKPEFQHFISSLKTAADEELRSAAFFFQDRDNFLNCKNWPLITYRYVSLINASYFRSHHAEFSKEYIDSFGSKFNLDLSHNGLIQPRLIKLLGQICALHTKPNEKVLELEYQTNGFGSDYAHPRFISMMLRLGDLLDIDNNRFNTGAELSFGGLPPTSIPHKEKHNATTQILITPEEIRFKSDCPNSEAYLEARRFVSWLDNEIDFLTKYWAKIVPKNLGGYAPSFECKELLINGVEDIDDVAGLRFEISQDKAFQIIEGSNIYEDRFIFIREVIQNAIDASKVQLWRDLRSGVYNVWLRSKIDDRLTEMQPYELEKNIYNSYPIKVDLSTLKDGRVKVVVTDHGTGISVETFKCMCNVGVSATASNMNDEENRGMPNWLKPTAGFGIGLQSIFLLTDQFEINTSTGTETLHAVMHSRKNGGYLQLQKATEQLPRGTTMCIIFSVPERIQYSIGGDTSRYLAYDMDPICNLNRIGEIRALEAIKSSCKHTLFPLTVTCGDRQFSSDSIIEQNMPSSSDNWEQYSKYLYKFDQTYERVQIWDKESYIYADFQFVNQRYHSFEFLFKGISVRKNLPNFGYKGISLTIDTYGLDTRDTISLDRNSLTRDGCKKVETIGTKIKNAFVQIIINRIEKDTGLEEYRPGQEFNPFGLWLLCPYEQRRSIPPAAFRYRQYLYDKTTVMYSAPKGSENEGTFYDGFEMTIDVFNSIANHYYANITAFDKRDSQEISIDYKRILEILNSADANINDILAVVTDNYFYEGLKEYWLSSVLFVKHNQPLILYQYADTASDDYVVFVKAGDENTKNEIIKGLGNGIIGMHYYNIAFGVKKAKRYAIPAINEFSTLAVRQVPLGVARPTGVRVNYIISPFSREDEEMRSELSEDAFVEMVASSDSFQSLVKYVMEHPVVVKDHKDKEQITEEYEKLIRDYYRIMSAENIDERKQ